MATELTRAALLNKIDTLIADNSNKEITAAKMREVLKDIVCSVFTKIDDQVADKRVFTLTGNGSTKVFTVTHNKNSKDLVAEVWKAFGDYKQVSTTIIPNGDNQTDIKFSKAPTAGQNYNVIIA